MSASPSTGSGGRRTPRSHNCFNTGGKFCRWAGTGGRPGVSPALVLTLQDAKAFDFATRPSTSATLVKISAAGIGDEAVFSTIGTVRVTLTVKKGDTYFEVHVYGFPVDQRRPLRRRSPKRWSQN